MNTHKVRAGTTVPTPYRTLRAYAMKRTTSRLFSDMVYDFGVGYALVYDLEGIVYRRWNACVPRVTIRVENGV